MTLPYRLPQVSAGPSDRKPPWLKVRLPSGDGYRRVHQTVRGLGLHTVCEAARCPNIGECWSCGTATVMLLGEVCTRGCRFCAVSPGKPSGSVDGGEPHRVAQGVARLGLRYVVLTMVTRDDLSDGGASQVAATVLHLRSYPGKLAVETLVSDFGGDAGAVDTVLESKPDVFAHNVEVVPRLTPLVRDRRCSYETSLRVLQHASSQRRAQYVKSSLMVGIGETDAEVIDTLADLRTAGVNIVTLGQYLRPSPRHLPVARFVQPARFANFAHIGRQLGFAYVASGPLVRSSYHAVEAFVQAEQARVGEV